VINLEREKIGFERKNAENESQLVEAKVQVTQLQSDVQQLDAHNKWLQQQHEEHSKLLAEARGQKVCFACHLCLTRKN